MALSTGLARMIAENTRPYALLHAASTAAITPATIQSRDPARPAAAGNTPSATQKAYAAMVRRRKNER